MNVGDLVRYKTGERISIFQDHGIGIVMKIYVDDGMLCCDVYWPERSKIKWAFPDNLEAV